MAISSASSLRSSFGILQIGVHKQLKIVARRRIRRKSVDELIEWRELIRVLQVCAIVKGDRLKNGREDSERIDLLGFPPTGAD